MKVVIVTPKSYVKFADTLKNLPFEFKIEVTTDIYMNMLGDWTEDECDNVIYIIEDDFFNSYSTS